MRKKILVLVCVAVLLLSISVVSAASTTFFTDDRDGYHWIGSGTVTGSKATAKLTGSQNSSPYIPSYDCSAESWVYAYDAGGNLLRDAHTVGDIYAKAEVSAGSTAFYKMKAKFKYNGVTKGLYTLYV